MRRIRILVVEDEAVIREILVQGLSEAGFDVDQAGDSDTAMKLLDEDGYNLLVTDVNMPGTLNGVELAERTHSHEAQLPIVIATAQPDMVSAFDMSDVLGAVLVKPFRLTQLIDLVHSLVQSRVPRSGRTIQAGLSLLPAKIVNPAGNTELV